MGICHIDDFKVAIRKLHRVEPTHRTSVPVRQVFQGKTIWDGVVEVFEFYGHPDANTAYGWSHETDTDETRHVTVPHVPPAVSPETAVRAFIIREYTGMPKLKPEPIKIGRPKLAEADAKGRIVPVRFKADDMEKIAKAAKKQNVTVSEWIRNTLSESIQ